MKKQEYEKRVESSTATLTNLTATANMVGYVKLIGIFVMGVALYFLFSRSYPVPIIITTIALAIILVALWIYHSMLSEKISHVRNIISINKRQLARISGSWVNFPDTGAEFISGEHPYSSDLDIVGQKSFFQYINTTHTWHGRRAFANDLLQPQYSNSELVGRQEAILELSKDIDLSSELEHCFSKIGKQASAEKLVSALSKQEGFVSSKALRVFLLYMPLVSFVFIVAVTLFRLDGLYIAAVTVAAVQAVVWIIGISKTHSYVQGISGLPYKLRAYSNVLHIIQSAGFISTQLKQLIADISTPSAAQAIKDLDKIAAKVSIRHNAIIWVIANILLLWDYECAFKFEQWRLKYAHMANKWFSTLGTFESLLCFSHLPNVCNNTCVPTIENRKIIEAQGMGHPLIGNNVRVNNTVSINDSIFIVSGSNMSGKTTFMRTVGINLVLARAGSYVCAKEMSFFPLELITSMRIADDLSEGISTFYAELKRVKSIVSLAEKTPNMLFLIDEIFRGTNSVDRLSGAKAVLTRINTCNAMGIITTHDLELCEIDRLFPRIKNYGFSEQYKDGQILFDYLLKPGKSITTNAKFLMQMVGI